MAGPALVLALLLVLPLPDVSGETHSLSYLYTIQSKSSPEGGYGFSAVTLLDDKQIDSYSSNSTDTDGTRTPKQDWLKKMKECEWKGGIDKMKSDGIELYKIFELQMKDLGHNASDGHVLQWTIRCEGEEHPDGSLSSVNGTNEFRYDRKTLISYNCTSKKWSREEEWKAGGGQDPAKKCEDCMKWLKLYLHNKTADIKQSGESSNCQISTGGLVVGMTVGVTVLLAAVLPVLAGIVVILKGKTWSPQPRQAAPKREAVPVVCVVPTQAGQQDNHQQPVGGAGHPADPDDTQDDHHTAIEGAGDAQLGFVNDHPADPDGGDLEKIAFIDDVLSIEAASIDDGPDAATDNNTPY